MLEERVNLTRPVDERDWQHPTKIWNRYVHPKWFYPCLEEFLHTTGKGYEYQIRFNSKVKYERRIVAFKYGGQINLTPTPLVDGPKLMRDIRNIVRTYGVEGTFTFADDYLGWEMALVILPETYSSMAVTLVAVCGVIYFVTFNMQVSIMVCICVLLVDLYLLALLYYWGLSFNFMPALMISMALGLAVDFSAHLGHCYIG